jgi:predicted MFS family arabinose efflux permease
LLGYSSSKAGLYFLPKIAATSIGSVLSGIYMSRTGEYRTLTITSACILFTSMVGYCTWTPSTSNIFMLVCLLMDGFAFGAIITLTLIAMLSCVGSSGKYNYNNTTNCTY